MNQTQLTFLHKPDTYRFLRSIPTPYKAEQEQFISYLEDNDLGLTYEGVSLYLEDLKRPQDRLNGRRYKTASFNKRRAVAFKLVGEATALVPMTDLQRRELHQALKDLKRQKSSGDLDEEKVLSKQEIQLVLTQCKDPKLAALIEFLYKTGARISEALGATWKDVQERKNYYVWNLEFTKNRKPRKIAIPKALMQRIRNLYGDGLYLFPGYNGTGLDRCYVTKKIVATFRECFPDRKSNFSAHCLRHSRLTHMAATGRYDVAALARFAGNSPQVCAKYYLHNGLNFEEQLTSGMGVGL